ncbi:glycosyltransferase family 2 protein [Microbacterium testaceum]|uniref:glycosyltransferase family 2 protein n=1 Tax=Microbacterium testaceum TaxID=2033 RepID=UPI0019D340B2|nr:glycosyltransferase family 2 protein [Microbacterium testaceum]
MSMEGMMTEKSVGVVVVTHNSGDQLRETLQHLGEGNNPRTRVWIVDSGSTPSAVPPADIGDRVIACANYGYGSSVNVAVREGLDADWIAVINPDSRIALTELERLASIASESGVNVTSAQLDVKDESGGHFSSLPTPPWKRRERVLRPMENGFIEVLSVQGAVMLIDRETFHQIDGFDEDFFLYFEEVDLCVRARQNGSAVAYFPGVSATHLGESSSMEVQPAWRAAERARGKYIYMKKHYGRISAILSALKDVIASDAPLSVARHLTRDPRKGLPMPARARSN